MKIAILLALSLLLTSCQGGATHATSADALKAEVLQVDAAYRDAVLRGDATKLATIFADDVLIVHSGGDRDNRNNFLDAISKGRLKLTAYERSDVEVRVYGSVALLYSKTTKSFSYRASPAKGSDTSIFTYAKNGERWKLVAMQNTPRGE